MPTVYSVLHTVSRESDTVSFLKSLTLTLTLTQTHTHTTNMPRRTPGPPLVLPNVLPSREAVLEELIKRRPMDGDQLMDIVWMNSWDRPRVLQAKELAAILLSIGCGPAAIKASDRLHRQLTVDQWKITIADRPYNRANRASFAREQIRKLRSEVEFVNVQLELKMRALAEKERELTEALADQETHGDPTTE
jgi:hypothetical protein